MKELYGYGRRTGVGLALAVLLAAGACSKPAGDPSVPTESDAPSGQAEAGSADGLWPVGISAGQVELASGTYCGDATAANMAGEATVSVEHGPVDVTVRWVAHGGGEVYGESTVEFDGSGAQTKKVTADWNKPWNTQDAVRVEFVGLAPGDGTPSAQYIPPEPLQIPYVVPNCEVPDIDVKIIGTNVAPQKCPSAIAQLLAFAQVTLNGPLSESTGPVSGKFQWKRNGAAVGDPVTVTFQPGGPKTLPVNAVWVVPINVGYTIGADYSVPVKDSGIIIDAPSVNAVTFCVS